MVSAFQNTGSCNRLIALALLVVPAVNLPTKAHSDEPLTMASVLKSADKSDWRSPDPQNTLYLELDSGRVIIELAPGFAPSHVANIKKLVQANYFDGLAIIRSQENYVVQWGDPVSDDDKRSLGNAEATLPGEYYRSASGLDFTKLNSRDAYAREVGFVAGFPVGRDNKKGRAWLAHCNAMVGAGRDVAPDSGNGAELYVVIGHAPRHLDRNVTLIGRVLKGMEHLSTLPRGTGSLGFYETEAEHTTIRSIRLASDVPEPERTALEVLRTDTETFRKLIKARTHRLDEWFIDPAGKIGLCNVPIPVRSRSGE